MKQSFNDLLLRSGLEPQAKQLIGQGGQLATYLVDVRKQKANGQTKVVIKETLADRDLASIYGYSVEAMLEGEALYTKVLGAVGLGPSIISNTDGVVIREYSQGSTLSELFLEADNLQAKIYLEESFLFLERVLSVVQKEDLLGYLDFNCNNILRDEFGKFSLIDHEWSILQYKTHEDLSVNTIYKYIRSIIRYAKITFDEIFECLGKQTVLSQYFTRVQVQLATGYFNVNDIPFQQSLRSCDELVKLLQSRQTSTPLEILDKLCVKMSAQSIRYCFGRRYDALFEEQVYKEKDIDLFVHPDDYGSFILLAQEIGFTLYNLTKFLYFSEATGQVVFLDLCLRTVKDAPDVQQIVENSVVRCERYIISDADLFILLIINSVSQRKSISSKYYDFLQGFLIRNSNGEPYVEEALGKAFGVDKITEILNGVSSGQWSDLAKLTLNSAERKVAECGLRNWLVLQMTSGPRLIAMLGVDGAGKSTTISTVETALKDATFRSEGYYLGCYYPPSGRGQSFILPTDWLMVTAYNLLLWARKFQLAPKKLISTKGSPQKRDAKEFSYEKDIDEEEWIPPLEKGGECDSFVFRLFAWLLVLDSMLMGVKLRLSQGYSFIFTDRYFYDLVTFLGERHFLSGVIARYFMPDTALFMCASPQVQATREPRHPLSEIKKNQALYRSIPEMNPDINWHEVSTEMPRGIVAQRVLFLCMSARRKRVFLKLVGSIFYKVGQRFRRLGLSRDKIS
ncbi:hypothetical protein [uncultured Kiloniella sp.]|uniref:hypothetical protein n=1 Tax=uncultured Kiloniella sp. TaxID=1133091 RepID=UPI002622BBAB|nr:hypothetical protein [uncultured Kiloniella sp.]